MAGHKINYFYCSMEKVWCSLNVNNVRLALGLLYAALLRKLWGHLTPRRRVQHAPGFVVCQSA